MDGIDLADAIEMLRAEIWKAHARGYAAQVRFPIQSITVELKLSLTKRVDGKVGFKVPFVGAELGGSVGLHQEAAQTVTLQLGPPVDVDGGPIPVAEQGDEDED